MDWEIYKKIYISKSGLNNWKKYIFQQRVSMLVGIEVRTDFEDKRLVIQGRLYRIWKRIELIFIYPRTISESPQSTPNLYIFSKDNGYDTIEVYSPR